MEGISNKIVQRTTISRKSATHPCFRIPRQTHWGWDEQKRIQFRRVDLYGSESAIPILTPPFTQADSFTVTYHRPLQSYFQVLAEAVQGAGRFAAGAGRHGEGS